MMTLSHPGLTAASDLPTPELDRLLLPIPVNEFWEKYWERRPLVVHRDDPDHYADLLTLDGIDEALTLAGADLTNIRVVVEGKEIPVSELGSGRGRNGRSNALETLYEHYRSGCTVVLNSLQDSRPSLQRAARALGHELGARIQMNIYLTPPGSQGFLPHYDTHDVFIAQAYGSKLWRLAGAPYELPLANHPHDNSKLAPDTIEDFELCSGDLLYLPRGTFHSGAANKTASAHVTIGLHPILWAQALQAELARVVDQDVRFRRSLPVGFARDETAREQALAGFAELVDALREQLSPEAMTTAAVDKTISMGLPSLRHHLLDLEGLPSAELDTQVRRRPGLRWNLTVEDGVAELQFHNKAIRFPADVAEEVRWVAEEGSRHRITGDEIPGYLNEPGRKTLIRSLLTEGFLTLR